MIVNIHDKKPLITYPCEWLYKVIGNDKESVQSAIAGIIQDNKHHVSESNISKTGKYLSFNVTVIVHDEEYRDEIYQKLKNHADIKMVL